MEQQKIIVLTCVHGRRDTFIKCFYDMPLDIVAVYSDESDREMLEDVGCEYIYLHENLPLSKKWNHGVKMLEGIDFDHVILLGSDDYFDLNFLDYVNKEAPKYDMIGFSDIYFEEDDKLYYWGGYQCMRRGEPAGAGKVYSKKYLESINYDLFPREQSKGLDYMSWNLIQNTSDNYKVTTLQENGLFLCDVKDGEGITSLSKIGGLIKL